ncbi:MAG: YceI family protein [Flavobacteriaceae bacterium]|nr:YceI family protein [Flavobacteriaceae bacterium]
MQKIILLVIVILISVLSFSCKKEKVIVPKAKYSFEAKTTTINWTAYKTTKKVPVKGVFKKIDIVNSKTSENEIEAINGLEFSIPVNSIDTKDKTRDVKIIQSFFGSMKDSQTLKGKINLDKEGKGNINLSLNGISKVVPITYVISGQLVEINAILNLDNWQTSAAITALNLACKDLHKGEDGISKTWNEVALNIVAYLKVE